MHNMQIQSGVQDMFATALIQVLQLLHELIIKHSQLYLTLLLKKGGVAAKEVLQKPNY
jgi:hypothetical protein